MVSYLKTNQSRNVNKKKRFHFTFEEKYRKKRDFFGIFSVVVSMVKKNSLNMGLHDFFKKVKKFALKSELNVNVIAKLKDR